VEGDFIAMGIGEAFGRVWKIAFKTTTYGKVNIQLPCGIEGISHGEAFTWFEGGQNFATRLVCDGKQPTPHDNDKILLQC
jgi:hypothetical protein